MRTNKDYTVHFKVAGGTTDYGNITVPKGTRVTHMTAMGIDERYHFVDDLSWVDKNYPEIASVLKHDLTYYGIDVPVEFVDKD